MVRIRRISVAVAMASIAMDPTLSYSFNDTSVSQFRRTHNCEACDLSHATLWKLDLKGAKARRATFTYTDFYLSDLSGADFEAADLTNAYLWNANFSRASFRGAILRNADLFQTNLSGADLTDANLEHAKVLQTNFSDARFCRTVMPDGVVENQGC